MDPYSRSYQYYGGFAPSQQQRPQTGVPTPLQKPPGTQVPRPAEGVGPVRYLFIGGFSGDTTQDELLPVVEAFGPVEVIRITPGKCCCFVRYADLNSAISAHEQLHGSLFKGGFLKVGWGKVDLQDEVVQPSRVLWVGSIDPLTAEGEIIQLFGEYGQILQARVLPAKFCAFITFHAVEDAVRARNALNGYNFKGKILKINFRKEDQTASTGAPMTPLGLIQGEINSLGKFPSAYIRLEDLPIRQVLPPPPDVKQVIDTFAGYVLRNGQDFETSSKARAAARLSFLNPDDPAHEYYRWKVYDGWCLRDRATKIAISYRATLDNMRKQQEQEQEQQQQQQAILSQEPQVAPKDNYVVPSDSQQSMGMEPKEEAKLTEKENPQFQVQDAVKIPPLPERDHQEEQVGKYMGNDMVDMYKNIEAKTLTSDEEKSLAELLGKLEPKKSVVKAAGNWVKERNESAREISNMVCQFFFGLGSGNFERKISVVYLISDITSLDERYRKALEKAIVGIVDNVIQDSRGESDLERIRDILRLWERSKVFGSRTLKRQREECEQPLGSEPDKKRKAI